MAKDMGTDMGNPLAIRQVDGKWKDGQSDRRTDRWTDRWRTIWPDGCTDGNADW